MMEVVVSFDFCNHVHRAHQSLRLMRAESESLLGNWITTTTISSKQPLDVRERTSERETNIVNEMALARLLMRVLHGSYGRLQICLEASVLTHAMQWEHLLYSLTHLGHLVMLKTLHFSILVTTILLLERFIYLDSFLL